MRTLRQIALAATCGVASVAFIGCQENRADIPSNAQQMAEGNQRISFTANDRGSAVVEDVSNQTIVYRGDVKNNDSLNVDPAQNQVTLNGVVVSNNALHGGDQYRIFFVPRSVSGMGE